MALTIDQLNALTKKHIAPRITNNVFDAIPLLSRLRKQNREIFTGGVQIEEPIIFQGTGQAGGFTGDGPLPTISQEHTTSAKFDLITYQVPLVVSQRQIVLNAGPNGIHKLLNVVREVSELDLKDVMSQDLFTGNESAVENDKYDGLQLAIDDDDSPKAYGDILTTDLADWKADDSAAFGAITPQKMQGVIGDVTFGLDRPTLIVCTQDIYDKWWGLLQQNERYTDVEEADGGFKFLRVSGIPLMVDPKVPSAASNDQTMYFLNETYMFWYTHKDVDMEMLPFQRPENAWNMVGHVISMNQLVLNRRKAHARRTGVDPTA